MADNQQTSIARKQWRSHRNSLNLRQSVPKTNAAHTAYSANRIGF
jgi:hypothetical protein